MNLNEIVTLLKQIVDGCPELEGTDFLIAPSKLPRSIVEGYEIHMTGKFDENMRNYLNDIAVSKELSINQEPTSIGLYKSKVP